LTRQLEVFTPIEEGLVNMYCCGPTVYSFVHIGNLRTFLWGDLLRRYLEWKGLKVIQVMNFTDIDDRIIARAGEQGQDLETYTAPYVDAFYQNIDALRIRRADIYPKATEHIAEMIELVSNLEARGHTYRADSSTYYKISSLSDYGKLSRIEITEQSGFSRLERDEDTKFDARDFVLWKGKKEGEPSWSAPVGEGRPGWHLECSAMSMKYLGETFDIHTGAVDLIFPHHENEIAQSEGSTEKPFVRYWVHGEHLIIEDQKMSKSLGNVYTLQELLDQGFDPLQIRYALLAVPYRTRLNFTLKSLEDAKNALERLDLFLMRMRELIHEGDTATGLSATGKTMSEELCREFEAAMDDDLNTAAALGALFRLIRDANIAVNEQRLSSADANEILKTIDKIDAVLDITPRHREGLDEDIEAMVHARNQARAQRDFAESDRLRDQLLARGIILEDTPASTRWRRK
ncbi:MAG TPA: cysteine--tRNA ligase, partial [Thermoanaerobaculia bacterium]|nr:cysteine--tRNA ligase [Thermoanaerobaculia bacterium]